MTKPSALAVALGAALAASGCVGETTRGGAAPPPATGAEAVISTEAPLPAAVARTRDRIVDAARQGDWAALDSLAGWTPEPDQPPFLYTLGPLMASPSAYWREYGGDDALREMVAVLTSEPSAGNGAFGWPSWAWAPPDAIPPADRARFEAVVPDPAAAYTDAGDYVGAVTSIDSTGRWLYYVAGD